MDNSKSHSSCSAVPKAHYSISSRNNMMSTTSVLSTVARRLEGKVALITGGASGIGETTAKLFTHHGAKVIIADVQDQVGQSLRNSLGPKDADYVHCDVRDETQIKNAVDLAMEKYGKLDIMFNNAGISDPYRPRISDIEKEDFEHVLSINVTGVFLGIKHASRAMIQAKSGSIISMASIGSSMGGAASHAYTCSKHAVLGLTRNAAIELGRFGVRVNCLAPFATGTKLARNYLQMNDDEIEKAMNEIANLKGVSLRVEDIANAALFLASDEARYVSGHNLFVDGGVSICNSAFRVFNYSDP